MKWLNIEREKTDIKCGSILYRKIGSKGIGVIIYYGIMISRSLALVGDRLFERK